MDSGEFRGTLETALTLESRAHGLDRPDLQLQTLRLQGAAQFGNRELRQALSTFLQARPLALQLRDFDALYAMNNNISWIHLQMDNVEAAAEFADQALAANRATGRYDPRPVVLRALIYAKEGEFTPAERLFSEVISNSIQSEKLSLAATAWNYLGGEYYKAGRLGEAEAAQTESFRLCLLHHLPELPISQRDLAQVLAAEGNLRTSTVLMDQALAKMGNPLSTEPVYVFYRERARLRMMKGDFAGALPDLRTALDLARRLDVIPTDDDRVTFESGMEELYSLFIEAGNRLYLENHDPRLKEETFAASEENRAASLRALVPHPNGWRTRLPIEHAELLARLQTAERALAARPDSAGEKEIRVMRANLGEIEARAGAPAEQSRATALEYARQALDADSAILAFHLGTRASWLWTITSSRFEVYPLAAKSTLAAAAVRFRDAVQARSPQAATIGAQLQRELFGSIAPDVDARTKWIFALDKDLFDLPLAALQRNGRYLIENHSLVVTPGVPMLRPAGFQSSFGGDLDAVGDPIYNRADSRWHNASSFWPFHPNPEASPLARLSGSRTEVRSALAIWGRGSILEGADASKKNVERILASSPAIIHLATHVIKSPRYQSGLIVLSLKPDDQFDFLDIRDIVLKPVTAQLIVMSGCASGDAAALPASGLMGLTRAWIGAGAGDVLATRWPALDDSGPFFAAFYRDLKHNPELGAAGALRNAQVEMLRSSTFRGSPDYWASYFLIGKQ